jgi:hypothetical protein
VKTVKDIIEDHEGGVWRWWRVLHQQQQHSYEIPYIIAVGIQIEEW